MTRDFSPGPVGVEKEVVRQRMTWFLGTAGASALKFHEACGLGEIKELK